MKLCEGSGNTEGTPDGPRYPCKWCLKPKARTAYKTYSSYGTRDKVCRKCRAREVARVRESGQEARRLPLDLALAGLSGKEKVAVFNAAKAIGVHKRGHKPDPTAYAIITKCRPEPANGDARWHQLCSLATQVWDEVYALEEAA